MESLSEVVVDEPIKETISSVELYQKVILQLISHSEFSRGRVILPESMQSELSDFLDREIKLKLDGLECHFSKSLQLGFRIRLEEKGYYLSFEEADFIRYFQEQLTQRSKMIIAPEA